jgi:hypothetical protein
LLNLDVDKESGGNPAARQPRELNRSRQSTTRALKHGSPPGALSFPAANLY